MSTSKVIEKWYRLLEFPSEFDTEFYDALKSTVIDPTVSIHTYDLNELDGKKNLLVYNTSRSSIGIIY